MNLLWLIFTGMAAVGAQEKKITIFFLHDKNRPDLSEHVNNVSKLWSQSHPNVEVNIQPFVASTDNEYEQSKEFCDHFAANGTTAFLSIVNVRIAISYHRTLQAQKVPAIDVDPTLSSQVEALVQYMVLREAADMVLIFEREADIEVALFSLINVDSGIRVVAFNGLDRDTTQRIKMLRPAPSYYVIFASTPGMMTLFDVAVNSGLVSKPEKWNLVFLDFQYAAFDEVHRKSPEIITMVIDMEICCRFLRQPAGCMCPVDFSIEKATIALVVEYFADFLLDQNLPTIIAHCEFDFVNDATQAVDKMLAPLFAQMAQETPLIYVADRDTLKNRKITPNLTMSVFSKPDNNSEGIQRLALIDRKQVHRGATIKRTKRLLYVGVVESIPWSWMARDPKTNEILRDTSGKPIWQGYCIDFLAKLAETMLFEYEMVLPAQGSFGKRVTEKVWDGVIGDLYAGRTDMIVAPLKMTAEREEIIDFVAPYFEQTGILIVMRNPVRETSLFKFMTVLRLEVWLSIVAALIATALTLWMLDKFSPYSARNNKDAYSYPCREFTLKESFWFALTSFTPQGGGEAPKAISGRTLVAAYWLFVVLMLATFTANLAAFLTVERMQTPVQSLEQLARQSRINYTVVANSDTHQYFINMKFAEDKLYQMWKEVALNSTNDQSQYRVWDYPIKEQWAHILVAINASMPVKTARDGFAKVNAQLNADFAFIHDAAEIKYEISRNCNLTEVGDIMAEQPYAVAVQQGSHLHDQVSGQILELQKDRFFEMLKAKYWNSSAKGECPNADDNEGITLESLGGVFIATLFGLALAMVTLVFEVLYHKKKIAVAESEKAIKQKIKRNILAVLPVMEPPKTVTIGDAFVPAAHKHKMNSMSMLARNPINQRNQ